MPDKSVRLEPSLNGKVSVHPISLTRIEVRIAGDLPEVWPERLAAALAERMMNIICGEAEYRGTIWTARFELDLTHVVDSAERIDYVTMLDSVGESRPARPIAVLGYGLARLPAALRLAIQAEDRSGLWADMLLELRYFGLYPRRLTLVSDSGMATQCFWLTTQGCCPPDVQTEHALREFLVKNRKIRRSQASV